MPKLINMFLCISGARNNGKQIIPNFAPLYN